MSQVFSISGADPDKLYAECSVIHQKYGTSEYSGLLEELPSLRELYGTEVRNVMKPAIDAFRQVRRDSLILYPTVLSTLENLKARGVKIAAFTESKAFYTIYRFKKLGLDGLIDVLYSPEDHVIREDIIQERRYGPDSYALRETVHHFTPEGAIKPNPGILHSIVRDMKAEVDEVIYLGDNLLKDVHMAQQAGIFDVYAAYGAAQHRPEYELLRQVTHWTPAMVERERAALKPGSIKPTLSINSFDQIADLFT